MDNMCIIIINDSLKLPCHNAFHLAYIQTLIKMLKNNCEAKEN